MVRPTVAAIALCLSGCTSSSRGPDHRDEPTNADARPGTAHAREHAAVAPSASAADGLRAPLLFVARDRALGSDCDATLLVYDDGRARLRGSHCLGAPAFAYTDRVSKIELDHLRLKISSPAYAESAPLYDEPDVLDGGSVTLADAPSQRRILVGNDPALPAELAAVRRWSAVITTRLRDAAHDARTEADRDLRLLAWHRTWRDDGSVFDFSVHADGTLELCQLEGDGGWQPHGDTSYPACRVLRLETSEVEPLRRAVTAPRLRRPQADSTVARAVMTQHLLVAGFADWLRIDAPAGHTTEVRAVLDALETLRQRVELP